MNIRAETLLTSMTLAEKVGQMTLVAQRNVERDDISNLAIGGLLSGGGGYPTPNTPEKWADMVDSFQAKALESRLSIPLIYGVDAVHGHNNMYGAVIFPHNIGLGATADVDLVRRIGRVTAKEMIATGIYWNYAPVVAIPQDIRWGRTYEAYGDDPQKVSALAAAFIEGLQGVKLSDPLSVVATPKHFIGDGATEFGTSTQSSFLLDQGDAKIDEATLRRIHLLPYQIAVQAGARTIMASYNSWHGTKIHGHHYLLTTVLKEELGFKGFVVSDWDAIQQIEPNNFYASVVKAVNAGIDMTMLSHEYRDFINALTHAIQSGDVSISRIDDAVRRILTVKAEMGLFETHFSNRDLLKQVGSPEHRAIAREAVSKSMVLLKNHEDLLPLPKTIRCLLVAGRAAHNIGLQSGGWTIEWDGVFGEITPGTTILDGIQHIVSSETVIQYSETGQFDCRKDTELNDSDPKAEVCVAVVGEEPYAEGRGDRRDLFLSNSDLDVLQNARQACQKLVVLIISGRPIIIAEQMNDWDALIALWLPGSEGGGVADVLFGDRPFTGRLPIDWPYSMSQIQRTHNLSESGEAFQLLFNRGFGLNSSILRHNLESFSNYE